MRLILAVFFVVQLNQVHNEVYVGQDYGTHAAIMEEIRASKGGKWFAMDSTNRPAIYWLASLCKDFTRDRYTYELSSIFWIILGVPALALLHRSLLSAIRAPELRIGLVALVAFLPAHLVAGVVFAGDIGVALPFALGAWALARSLEATARGPSLGFAALAGLALAAGTFVKVSFLMLPVATVATILLVWRWGRIDAARAGLIALLAVLFPLVVGGALYLRNARELARAEGRHVFFREGSPEVNWRTLLWFRGKDAFVLNAPTYWAKNPEDQLILVQPNVFSYPALLHLGVFTDVLNYAPKGGYLAATPRPEPQQSYAVLAVRNGMLWSALAAAAWLALGLLVLGSLFKPALAPPTGLAVWAVQGAVWFLPIMLSLPYLRSAYTWGYWLPRLVVPGLWAAAFVSGWFLDRVLPSRTRWWYRGALALALLQTWWHLRSMWF